MPRDMLYHPGFIRHLHTSAISPATRLSLLRSKIPRPRRVPTARRPRQPAAAPAPALAVTVLPGRQFFRLSRSGRGQQPLAPRDKLATVTDSAAAAAAAGAGPGAAAQVLTEVVHKGELERDVGDAVVE